MARAEVAKTPLAKRLQKVRKLQSDPTNDRVHLAALLGSTKGSMGNYERGDTLPDASLLAQYRTQLNINLNWLLTGDGNVYDDATIKTSSGDASMSEDQGTAEWNREAFAEALEMANAFEEKQGGKKLMPKAKIDLIDMFYKEIITKK